MTDSFQRASNKEKTANEAKNAYVHCSEKAAAAYQDVAAAKAEEGTIIKDAMKEAEESYKEMMEIHEVLDQAYQDLMKWRN